MARHIIHPDGMVLANTQRMNNNLVIDEIFDLTRWQELQDSIASVTKLAILTVDYKGTPVTRHSSCSRFCAAVRQNPQMDKYCQKCDARGGLEAARVNQPYLYLCHYNLLDLAIPIIVEGKYVGALMAGQIRLSDMASQPDLEQVVTLATSGPQGDNLRGYFDELPIMALEEVKKVANMLSLLCNYLIEQASERKTITEVHDHLTTGRRSDMLFNSYSEQNLKTAKKHISNAIVSACIVDHTYGEQVRIRFGKTLRPAIDYIYQNKSENPSIDMLSGLCRISPSYFSRLFSKEAGESYSSFMAKLKIYWARRLLENSSMNINEISDELGFSECGYFIKVFKRHEGVTPFIYRKYLQQ